MIHNLVAGLALQVALMAAPAVDYCPPPSDVLLFHSCWGQGRLNVVLLPEGLPLPETASQGLRLVVTGVYTATDSREGGLPKPVGLFVNRGKVINPNLGRMDGVLLVDPADNQLKLQHRARLSLDGNIYDLTDLEQRHEFITQASERGLSVVQSHLLIVDNRIDVYPREDAPVFVRRMLFTDDAGFGIYQTREPRSLYDAATQLAEDIAPRMALNLDMGSYDYCQRAEDGAEIGCGGLDRNDTSKLSNLLILTLN